MDKLSLIARNTEEIVTKEELEALVDSKNQPKAYVGYEPSGKIHMGHVLTVNKLLDLQQAGFQITVLLADVHAYLNEKGTMDEVKKIADYNKRCFIALGLDEKKTRVIGRAYIDESRCIAWSDHQDCIVCEEMCPVAEKAIRLEEAQAWGRDGTPVTVKLPHVLRDLCIGCGICEYKCPLNGESAIRVYVPQTSMPF